MRRIAKDSIKGYARVYHRAILLLWRVSPILVSIQVLLFLIQAIVPVLTLIATKKLFDVILESSKSFETVLLWLLFLAGLQLIQVLLSQGSAFFSEIYQEKLTDSVNGLILEKSIEIPYPFFEDPNYYDSLHLAQRQSIYKLPMLFQQIQGTFSNSLSLALLIGYFFSLISSYAWVILIIALPLAFVKWYSGFALHRLESKTVPLEREADYYHYILTGESYAQEIRSLNFGQSLLKRFRELRTIIFEQKKALQKKLLAFSLIAELLEVLVLFYILIGVARKAFEGVLGVSLLIVYIQGIQRMQSNLKNFLNSLVQLIQLRIFLKDIFRFLDIATQSEASGKELEFPTDDFSIQVQNLSFSYPGTEQESLQNISMKFEVGKVIGIVGANGSGKSTLVKLLAGLYRPGSGEIKLGDYQLEDIDSASFRENSLFLFQDFQRYFLSIEDLISLGKSKQTEHELRLQSAIQKAQAESFISNLPDGWKSKLGRIFDEGRGLSGGQWQKLALARAFYRDPKLVVLDEPTSALDAISEMRVFEELKKESAERMNIWITHRLYNLKDADYIYVLDSGRIKQEGIFQDLIREKGIFQDLYQKQGF
ncbi:ABC transporter ATP-binding protein [Algoriphagus limi]|uniref:ABC transporter ATP-binding protein/permease n=1 Tax=Algoriphagus limi TaxID=2975273 RepID=A0ABT2G5E0_9BACT|nr:ABC transporter ATP-binding protein [Algoriphagus limi]MCS5489157.1 ABC transporter ATP-binding protein/permease [Algoriphagus limi]